MVLRSAAWLVRAYAALWVAAAAADAGLSAGIGFIAAQHGRAQAQNVSSMLIIFGTLSSQKVPESATSPVEN
jgi:hypothetical protein